MNKVSREGLQKKYSPPCDTDAAAIHQKQKSGDCSSLPEMHLRSPTGSSGCQDLGDCGFRSDMPLRNPTGSSGYQDLESLSSSGRPKHERREVPHIGRLDNAS